MLSFRGALFAVLSMQCSLCSVLFAVHLFAVLGHQRSADSVYENRYCPVYLHGAAGLLAA